MIYHQEELILLENMEGQNADEKWLKYLKKTPKKQKKLLKKVLLKKMRNTI